MSEARETLLLRIAVADFIFIVVWFGGVMGTVGWK